MKKILGLLLSLTIVNFLFSQDETPYKWDVKSQKLADKKYQLIFSTSGSNSWQLYAPMQIISDVKTTELQFADSSIKVGNEILFSEKTKTITNAAFEGQKINVSNGAAEWKVEVEFAQGVPAQLQGKLLYTYGKGEEFYPGTEYDFNVALEGGKAAVTTLKVPTLDIANPLGNCGNDNMVDTKGKGLWAIFLAGIIGGLIALITPCVFPMIPVTVSFFTKKSGDRKKAIRNGVLYGLFIFLIYVAITLPFHLGGGVSANTFNDIATNVWLNILFFIIFLVFAISFFGYFEIGLPPALANKMDSKSSIGNVGGIFFMALTLTIVSFSCTGPIFGTLLATVGTQGGAWALTAGAAGFGIALGLPFALFAMFPNWLQSLPKSGGWMTDVKVVLGFIELALAVKFLSNADLVKQWGLIKGEVFIAIWILIAICTVLYLFGILKFPHSSPVKKFGFSRIAFIVLFGAFGVYLFPGLFNARFADLKLISGFPPPRFYSLFEQPEEFLKNDLDEAIKQSKEQNKPIILDFTGWGCVNCRKFEASVWTNSEVHKKMKNDCIVVSLYVDDKRNLPLEEQTEITDKNGNKKRIVTIGDKWATFQSENFDDASQPMYVMITPDMYLLTNRVWYPYTPQNFAKWIDCGIEAYKKHMSEKK